MAELLLEVSVWLNFACTLAYMAMHRDRWRGLVREFLRLHALLMLLRLTTIAFTTLPSPVPQCRKPELNVGKLAFVMTDCITVRTAM